MNLMDLLEIGTCDWIAMEQHVSKLRPQERLIFHYIPSQWAGKLRD